MGFLAAAGLSRAADLHGVKIPETAEVSGQTLVLNGFGVRTATILNVRVYVAAVYLPQKTSDPDNIMASEGPIRLDLTYLRAFGQESVSKAWRYQFKESADHAYPGLDEDVEKVVSFFGPLAKGGVERIEIEGDETRFYDQGTLRGSIRGRDFRKAFLSLWFGPKPPTKDLQKGLLGLSPL